MAKHIVIATHSLLAKGLKEALRFIFEPKGEVHTLCAFIDDTNFEDSISELFDSFSPSDTVVVATDITAGSVNKIIASHLAEKNFHLVSGVNLAFLLEISLADEEQINAEFINGAITLAKDDIVYMNERISKQENEIEDFFWINSIGIQ